MSDARMSRDNSHSPRAIPPVEAGPGVLVHPTADRRLAITHWLLSTLGATGRDRAREEWAEESLAMLPLGTLFTAVRIPGRLIHAIAGTDEPVTVDAFLTEALGGGPVICDPRRDRYYALTPAGVPRTWRKELGDLGEDDVDFLGRDAYLGVPRVDATGPHAFMPYWSVPMDSAGELCASALVGRMVALGRELVGGELELDGPQAALHIIREGR